MDRMLRSVDDGGSERLGLCAFHLARGFDIRLKDVGLNTVEHTWRWPPRTLYLFNLPTGWGAEKLQPPPRPMIGSVYSQGSDFRP